MRGGLLEEATVGLRPVTQQLGLGGNSIPGKELSGFKGLRGWDGAVATPPKGGGRRLGRNGFLWGSQEP